MSSLELPKTARGIVPSFSEIFTGARYARQLYSNRKQGTAHDKRQGELFVSVPWNVRDLPSSFDGSSVLVATPSREFMAPRFSPRIASRGAWNSIPPACVTIRDWGRVGYWLILAGDPNHINDERFALVPRDQTFKVGA